MATTAKPQDRVNDFAFKMATVNGTGSASANGLLMQAIFRMGIPGHGQEHLPVEHPGPAHLVRDPREQGRLHGPSGRVDLMVALNAETYAEGRARGAPGGYLLYDSTWPRRAELSREDITILGVPFAKLCDERFAGVRDRT